MSSKSQANNITNASIQEEIKKYSKMKPIEYTSTLYDEHGKLLDDEITEEDELTYWSSFVGARQASELVRRLAIVEELDYEDGSLEFDQMEDEDELCE